jgi:hypothetical protein
MEGKSPPTHKRAPAKVYPIHSQRPAFMGMTTRLEEPMTVTLNHTIVPARDKNAAAQWFASLLS